MHKVPTVRDGNVLNQNDLIHIDEALKCEADNLPNTQTDLENPKNVLLSHLTYLSELVTVLYTFAYTAVQDANPAGPNGFCIESTDTHLYCTVLDTFVFGMIWAWWWQPQFVHNGRCRQLGILTAAGLHIHGHWLLYSLTKHMSVNQISHYRHWSFALVLLLINMGYCLPRLVMYMPSDTKDRCKPKALSASFGILLLMAVAWLERFYCEHVMAPIGGHLVYDTVMAFVVLATF